MCGLVSGDVGPVTRESLTRAEGFFDDRLSLTLCDELVRGQEYHAANPLLRRQLGYVSGFLSAQCHAKITSRGQAEHNPFRKKLHDKRQTAHHANQEAGDCS